MSFVNKSVPVLVMLDKPDGVSGNRFYANLNLVEQNARSFRSKNFEEIIGAGRPPGDQGIVVHCRVSFWFVFYVSGMKKLLA